MMMLPVWSISGLFEDFLMFSGCKCNTLLKQLKNYEHRRQRYFAKGYRARFFLAYRTLAHNNATACGVTQNRM
jgi:hypothetical protein